MSKYRVKYWPTHHMWFVEKRAFPFLWWPYEAFFLEDDAIKAAKYWAEEDKVKKETTYV